MQEFTGALSARQQREFELASSIVTILSAAYPGYAWSACVDARQGIIKIVEPTFMDSTIPFVIHLHEVLYSEKVLRSKLAKVGGEILERFFLPRETVSKSRLESKILALPKDIRGNAKFDGHCVPNWIGK
jgi:hypothetical protein